jgi:hypothetical protein
MPMTRNGPWGTVVPILPAPMAKVLRKLILLGLPLAPLSCGGGLGPCPPPTKIVDEVVDVHQPPKERLYGLTTAEYEACVRDPLMCMRLCEEVAREGVAGQVLIKQCERVARPGDPVGDGGAPIDALKVHLAFEVHHCVGGRRPEGLAPAPPAEGNGALGHWWAELAYLEAASVPAFRRLARELEALGAPPALPRAARRAAGDEIRHRRITRAMAARHGVRARTPRPGSMEVRSLFDVARENAVEGCVGETYGAAVAAWQARTAGDPLVRALMAEIARDEAEHAALAWAVDQWAVTGLAPDERRMIDHARREAGATLAAEVSSRDPEPRLRAALGLPSKRVAAQMVGQAMRSLWC